MSVAPDHLSEPHNATGEVVRPVRAALRVIHCDGEERQEQPRARDTDWLQDELPLPWRSASRGLGRTGLASYPPLPLAAGTPRPDPSVAHCAALVADVVAGARPASQLSRWATLEVQQRLARRSSVAEARRAWSGRSARISSTSTMVVSGKAVLVTVVFLVGSRAHAAAIRMEFRHGRWQVTDVQTPA